MSDKQLRFDTLAVRGGYSHDPATMAHAVPIYQTSAYVFKNSEHAANLFALKEFGNIYTRIMNPTEDVFEQRMALLEGGVGALAVSSGMAAINYSILNIAGAGDEIIASQSLYGGTFNLFNHTFPKIGLKVHFVDLSNPDNIRGYVNDKTKAVFVESLGNPKGDVADIEGLAKAAHEYGLPLIVDNTLCTPYLLRPIEHGADIVVYSATKYIGGHGNSIGGVIVDSGKFDWQGSGRFPGLVEADPSYHGVKYVEALGPLAYIVKCRVQLLRDTGSCISPFNSFLFLQGIETLSLRMDRHCQNAQTVAEFLQKHPRVRWVNYPGLPGHPYHELAKKYLPKGKGAFLTFGIDGGLESGRKFIDSLKIFSNVANIGDVKSLVIHPASTTHQQLNEEEQKLTGVTPELVRLCIGIEDVNDLMEDLDQALNQI